MPAATTTTTNDANTDDARTEGAKGVTSIGIAGATSFQPADDPPALTAASSTDTDSLSVAAPAATTETETAADDSPYRNCCSCGNRGNCGNCGAPFFPYDYTVLHYADDTIYIPRRGTQQGANMSAIQALFCLSTNPTTLRPS